MRRTTASIAWAFNIRGGDVSCTPLPLGRAILFADGSAELFLDEVKVSGALRQHLGNSVTLRPLADLEKGLADLKGKTVSVDPDVASAWFFDQLEQAGATPVRQRDPVALPKACKNDSELAGSAAAHIRDGVALTRFLHWLDTDAQSGEITEIDAADYLTLAAAWRLDQGLPANREIASAKLYATEMLARVTDATLQIYGGMGLMDDFPIERFWRDARVERIWDGTSEIQRHIISRDLLRPLGA